MKRFVLAATVAVAILGAGAGASTAAAAGLKGASLCSGSMAPVGFDPWAGAYAYGNAGEIVRWNAQTIGHTSTYNASGLVSGACNPS